MVEDEEYPAIVLVDNLVVSPPEWHRWKDNLTIRVEQDTLDSEIYWVVCHDPEIYADGESQEDAIRVLWEILDFLIEDFVFVDPNTLSLDAIKFAAELRSHLKEGAVAHG